MRHATSLRALVVCSVLLAGRAGAQPVVVAELRVTAPAVLEHAGTIGSPAAVRALQDRWVAEVRRHFGFVTWKRADEAPAGAPRLILTLSEERTQGCQPGRLKLTLSVGGSGGAAALEWSAGEGKSELKGPCDISWQDAPTPDPFAADFQRWIEAVPFSPDGIEWIESALLRNVDLVSGIVSDNQHLFLPVSPRALKASGDSLIRVRFGRDPVDGFLWGRPCPGQGDRTQVLVTAFNCRDTTSSPNFDAERVGTGMVWHPLLQSVLQSCQSPIAVMWHYVADAFTGDFAPPAPGAANLPAGGTALDPDGGR